MVASVLLGLVSAISITLAIVSLLRWHIPAARPLLLLFVALAIWSSGFAFEIILPELAQKLLATKVQYVGIVAIPVAWLVFAKRYGTLGEPISRRIAWLLWIEPFLVLLLLATNEQHHLFYTSLSIKQTELLGPMLKTAYGPAFWAHALYSYIMLLAGSSFLLRALLRSTIRGRQQLIGPLLATLIPWVANAVTLLGLVELDITPFAFAATGIIWAWSLFRVHVLDLIPIARDEVLESMSDGVIVLNDQRQVLDVNYAALTMMNRSRAQVINRQLIEVLPEYADILMRFRPVMRASEEIQITDPNGRQRWFDLRISPLNDRLNQHSGRLIVMSDITERKHAEAILLAAKEAAERTSRTKTSFLMNMSHELLTPLNAIIGYSELLLVSSDHAPAEYAADLRHIKDSGQSLLNMVRDVLDLTQAEAGTLLCTIQPFKLDQFVDSLAETIEPALQRHQNQLKITSGSQLGILHSDPEKLGRILVHLLDNAAKFTEHGIVTLTITRTPLKNQECVVFRIADTGSGIASNTLDELFQPFAQEDTSSTRRHGGMGIGLAIVHQFCKLLGGELTVASIAGEGSTFELTIPDHTTQYVPSRQTITNRYHLEEQINGVDLTR